ncbi:hypothetical protein GALL_119250 [mine drainage metagenome]|uniref:HEPN AbiU2-like domain-containing protein n=1 Tax=mine drainage metagenome TaxID=410659 RepID=A0A1J5SBR0_9ZZZZ
MAGKARHACFLGCNKHNALYEVCLIAAQCRWLLRSTRAKIFCAGSIGRLVMVIAHYNSEVFMTQFPIVKRFVYHVVYYRALLKQYSERQLQNEFWTLTIDAHLLQAVVHWCMIFGSDGTNPTHWKHLSTNQSSQLEQTFRDGLFRETYINQEEWNRYWKEMKHFRDNYAAHRTLNNLCTTPHLDMALKVAYFYDDWIREVISPHTFDEPPLKEFASTLLESTSALAGRLFDATKVQ